jgi:hypothetical protein
MPNTGRSSPSQPTSTPRGGDFYPATSGDINLAIDTRPLAVRLTNRYVDRVQAAAETDTVIADRFLKVAGFSDSPASLLSPSVVLRVAAVNWRQSRARSSSRTPSLIPAR